MIWLPWNWTIWIFISALLKRWWHCLWRLHRSIDINDFEDAISIRACECGRVFYATEDYEQSPAWGAAKAHWNIPDKPGPTSPGAMKGGQPID